MAAEEIMIDAAEQQQETLDITNLSDEELQTQIEGIPEGESETDKNAEPAKIAQGTNEPEKKEEAGGETETVTLTKEELDKIQRQVKEKELMIARQANEVGELRKRRAAYEAELAALKSQPVPQPDDILTFAEMQAEQERKASIANRESEVQKIAAQESELSARNAVFSHVPDVAEYANDMAEILKADGIPEQVVHNAMLNPFAAMHPDTIINLVKRAELQRENATLKARITELETKPDSILAGIAKAAKSKQPITGKSGQSKGTEFVISEDQISSLSDAELDAAISQLK